MSVIAAFMVPHPPMIVPQVGRGSEQQITRTIRAYEQVADEIAALAPETIIITSPHSVMYSDYFHISPGREARGNFGSFRAPQVSFDEKYDAELASEISELARQAGFPAGPLGERDKRLDHGTMVPLYFIRQKFAGGRIVRIGLSGLPLTEHYKLGMMIRDAVEQLGRRAVFVASGDLSHKLQDYGPYGYAPEGPMYDARIMDVCARASFGELFEFDENFCDKAAECGHRSFVIMAGAFDGVDVKATQLSHEDVTGVGYGICTFYPVRAIPCGDRTGVADMSGISGAEVKAGGKSGVNERNDVGLQTADPDRQFLAQYLKKEEEKLKAARAAEDPYVQLARRTLELYIRHHKILDMPSDLPQEMKSVKAGAFVSIHEHGRLRGCIGTIAPTQDCVAKEIIGNAISASTRDPRFDPIRADELPWLEINVDVLGDPEPVSGPEELDVKRYGVIVTKGRKRGLLLPDLEGVDTVEQQISIAKSKAGIGERDRNVQLERFEVVRHR